jgi:superoxide dismutase, Cu-Zn family
MAWQLGYPQAHALPTHAQELDAAARVAIVVYLPRFFSPNGALSSVCGVKMSRWIHGIAIRCDIGVSAARSYFHFLSNVMTIRFAAATAVLLLVLAIWAQAPWAQVAQRVSIAVPAITRAQPSSTTQLSIRVGPQEAVAKNSFIRVRGLPPTVAVSSGYAAAPGEWIVPLIAIPNLTIILPVEVQEKSDVVIELVKEDGKVLAEARTVLVVATNSAAHSHHQPKLAAAAIKPDLDPSPLVAISKAFDAFLANRGLNADQEKAGALSAGQKAEAFRLFLTWPQNPLEVEVTMRLTSESGVGAAVGTIAVKNSEVIVAGRKESALLLQPNLRGLPPGLYAFHVHENPSCGSALKDGKAVPGLAAGAHLWLSGTGQLSGTTFTSHLGDLPNLEVVADGTATRAVVAARLSLADVANRALMMHASQDDNSARMACGRLN